MGGPDPPGGAGGFGGVGAAPTAYSHFFGSHGSSALRSAAPVLLCWGPPAAQGRRAGPLVPATAEADRAELFAAAAALGPPTAASTRGEGWAHPWVRRDRDPRGGRGVDAPRWLFLRLELFSPHSRPPYPGPRPLPAESQRVKQRACVRGAAAIRVSLATGFAHPGTGRRAPPPFL